jgi:hypothetical protein
MDPSAMCYNRTISGKLTQHDVRHIQTMSLESSKEKKLADKESRKAKSAAKASQIITQAAAMRNNPEAAPNADAAVRAAEAVRFEHGERASSSPPSSASPSSSSAASSSSSSSSSSSGSTATEANAAFLRVYQQMDLQDDCDFTLVYEPDSSDEEAEG